MRKYFLTIVLIYLFTSCNKDNKHPIPDVPVYINPIYIFDAEYNRLLDPYGMIIIKDEGYLANGILVVNTGFDENSNYKFAAYDASCPYDLKQGCVVDEDESSISIVKCNCCGSKYEITFGAVNTGPSNYPLKTYKTAFDGNYLRIYN